MKKVMSVSAIVLLLAVGLILAAPQVIGAGSAGGGSSGAAISATGVWMSVIHPNNYASYYTTNSGYVQYIPVTVEILNNSMNPYKGIKVVMQAHSCQTNYPTNCQTYSQTKYTNSAGRAIFIEVLPYLVNDVDLSVSASKTGTDLADFGERIPHIGD